MLISIDAQFSRRSGGDPAHSLRDASPDLTVGARPIVPIGPEPPAHFLRNIEIMNRSAPWRLLFAVILVGFWTPASSQGDVSAQLEAWYTQTLKKAPGLWGVVVADEQGEVVWSVNGAEPM